MGFVNQSIEQMRDLLTSMTPAARITVGLLLAVIGVSLAFLFEGYAGGADEYLFAGEFLSPREADRVEAAIASAGLTGYERDGGRIRVPKGQKAAYLAAVADGGALPANFDQVLEESLDVGPFVDRATRQQRAKAARERQLSMIISQMSGIEEAKVLFDIREAHGFGKEKVTATVSVQPGAGESLDSRRQRLIRGAVAGAIAGLTPSDVTILNLADGSSYDQSGKDGADDFDEPYFQTRVAYEQVMRQRIEDFLRAIPGVRVQVSAELDPMLGADVRSTRTDNDPVPIRDTNRTQEIRSTRADDRGRPGLAAQGPNRAPPEESVARSESTETTSDAQTENFIPFSEEQMRKAGLVPNHVRAAIAIPSNYIERVWKERNPDGKPTAGDLQNVERELKDNITNTVTALFPKETGENPYPNVQVTVFQSLTPEAIAPESIASKGFLWASQNSGSLVMAGLALVSLVMLRSIVRSIPPSDTKIVLAPRIAEGTTPTAGVGGGSAVASEAAPAGRAGAGGEFVQAARGEKPRPRLKLKKGVSLKDDLADLVREDPDSAASILKSWIGNAG